MTTIQHDPHPAPVRLVYHFTPRAQACWSWGFFRPVVTPTAASERVPNTPEFATQEAAEQWAEAHGVAYMT